MFFGDSWQGIGLPIPRQSERVVWQMSAFGLMRVDPDAVWIWLGQSCARQGLSVIVAGPGVIARVGVLLGGRLPRRGPRQGACAADAGHSRQVGMIRDGSSSRAPGTPGARVAKSSTAATIAA